MVPPAVEALRFRYDERLVKGERMVWIMLATLAVVFVVGFRVLTSDSRRAIKRLSERLGSPRCRLSR
jgi:hypothetical protein